MRQILLAASLALVGFGSQAMADDITETWRITEGSNGATRGTWQITRAGNMLNGTARMYLPNGALITYGVAATVGDGLLVVHRVNPSDGSQCQYLGQPGDGGAISGTTICNGSTDPWTVQVVSTSMADGVPRAARRDNDGQ